MNEETVDVAEAKKHFSELLGLVAYGKKRSNFRLTIPRIML